MLVLMKVCLRLLDVLRRRRRGLGLSRTNVSNSAAIQQHVEVTAPPLGVMSRQPILAILRLALDSF